MLKVRCSGLQYLREFHIFSASEPLLTVSRNVLVVEKPTIGLGGGFLYILLVGHDTETSFTFLISSLLLKHMGPALAMSWSNLFSLG